MEDPGEVRERFLNKISNTQWIICPTTSGFEISKDPQNYVWKGSVEIKGVSFKDAKTLAKFQLGEDQYARSGMNSFTEVFDPFPPGVIATPRKSTGDTSRKSAAQTDPSIGLPPMSMSSSTTAAATAALRRLPGRSSSNQQQQQQQQQQQNGSSSAVRSSGQQITEESADASTSESEGELMVNDDDDDIALSAVEKSKIPLIIGKRLSKMAVNTIKKTSLIGTPIFERTTSLLSPGTGNGSMRNSSSLVKEEPIKIHPKKRKISFVRYEYEACIITVDNNLIESPGDDEEEDGSDIKHIPLDIMGVLIEEKPSSSTNIKITFVLSLDPQFEKWECELLNENHNNPLDIGFLYAKFKIEDVLSNVVSFFSNNDDSVKDDSSLIPIAPNVRELLSWRHQCIDDRAWTSKQKDFLLVGTLFKHIQYGHGYVDSFDMRGTMKVKYDLSTDVSTVVLNVEEREKFRVLLNEGDRVKHSKRGFGTLQSSIFDRLIVRYDNGHVSKYAKLGWGKKFKKCPVSDDDCSPLVKLSHGPHETVREGMGRAQFIVPDVTPSKLLQRILSRKERVSSRERSYIIDRKVIKSESNTRVLWEHRQLPKPLSSRSFVSTEKVSAVSNSIMIQNDCFRESSPSLSIPKDEAGVVRGLKVVDTWIIEPHTENSSFVTHVLCLDLSGFVAPETVVSVRDGILLSEALDCMF